MLVVVAAADPEPRPRLINRYLVAALRCRHPDPPRRDQDRPRRPHLVPAAFRGARPGGVHQCQGRDAPGADRGFPRGPLDGVRRPLGSRQVDSRQCARADRPACDGARECRDRPRAPHVELHRLAALSRCRTAAAGSSTPPACGRSGSDTSTRPTSSAPSPSSMRSHRTALADAPTSRTHPTAPSSRLSGKAGWARAARPGWTRSASARDLRRQGVTAPAVRRDGDRGSGRRPPAFHRATPLRTSQRAAGPHRLHGGP